MKQLPSRADVCRKIVGQLGPETLYDFRMYLFLLSRAVEAGRLEVAKRSLDELRKELGAGKPVNEPRLA